ncbi:MAG: hypothetical protein IT168_33295 [Bryobacterales bacterium]|nr:hypothetical protein [Bryobacterales bacterium]
MLLLSSTVVSSDEDVPVITGSGKLLLQAPHLDDDTLSARLVNKTGNTWREAKLRITVTGICHFGPAVWVGEWSGMIGPSRDLEVTVVQIEGVTKNCKAERFSAEFLGGASDQARRQALAAKKRNAAVNAEMAARERQRQAETEATMRRAVSTCRALRDKLKNRRLSELTVGEAEALESCQALPR